MSVLEFEFVVVQKWTKYEGPLDMGRWLDYSRCTARQAQSYISPEMAESGLWRVVHWIRKEEVLTTRQLDVMSVMVPSQWENRPPTDGDHWSVTVVWNTHDRTGAPCQRIQGRFVDGWTGPGWLDMINDISREREATGDTVESIKLH